MRKSLVLKNFLKKRKCTFLNIGPMSKNIVDTAIDISDKYNIPLTLIASRRQIDNENFSGGYVNNWNTKTFADYVKKKSKKKNIFLARDHGGPWQNDIEVNNNYGLKKAMDSSKESFKSDIEAGFDFLHLDTSIDPQKKMKPSELFERLFELYEFLSYRTEIHTS
jgi:tagatose-1,6-bisphosphate aldolase non-catalytic subunit AgaZ/GatZ